MKCWSWQESVSKGKGGVTVLAGHVIYEVERLVIWDEEGLEVRKVLGNVEMRISRQVSLPLTPLPRPHSPPGESSIKSDADRHSKLTYSSMYPLEGN